MFRCSMLNFNCSKSGSPCSYRSPIILLLDNSIAVRSERNFILMGPGFHLKKKILDGKYSLFSHIPYFGIVCAMVDKLLREENENIEL